MGPEEGDRKLIGALKRGLPHPYSKIKKDDYQDFPPSWAPYMVIYYYDVMCYCAFQVEGGSWFACQLLYQYSPCMR
jgi:hypothetical protein